MNFTPNFAGIISALKYIIENGISGSGGGNGGGGSSATATKQDEQTAKLTNLEADVEEIRGNFLSTTNLLTGGIVNINNSIGSQNDGAAASDNPPFASLISLFKRLLQRLSLLIGLFMPAATETEYIGTSAGANLKASPGNIYAITVSNGNNAIRYFQIFNKASNPILNDVPVRVFPIPGSDSLFLLGQDVIGGNGIVLSTGVTWGFSTTRLSYTAGTPADCIVSVRWA